MVAQRLGVRRGPEPVEGADREEQRQRPVAGEARQRRQPALEVSVGAGVEEVADLADQVLLGDRQRRRAVGEAGERPPEPVAFAPGQDEPARLRGQRRPELDRADEVDAGGGERRAVLVQCALEVGGRGLVRPEMDAQPLSRHGRRRRRRPPPARRRRRRPSPAPAPGR
jgi:hypothetical protein